VRKEEKRPCVIIHGGAGKLPDERARKKLPVMRRAAEAAWEELHGGKSGEFAVVAALREMEGSDFFNAGYGGYPNVDGIVLLDVGLMRGARDFVSILNARRMKYPSAVALDLLRADRSLMTVWTHQLMQEVDGAADFIKERYGWVPTHEDLLSPVVEEWLKNDGGEFSSSGETSCGTVGCVVRDLNGDVCAGTSTGGVNSKDNGRIGDTPVIGSGVFADNEIGALSTTGHGESLMLGLLSGFVLGELRRELREHIDIFRKNPDRLSAILENEFQELSRKTVNKGGGMIIVPPHGSPNFAFNSEMISIAHAELKEGSSEVELQSFIAKSDGTFLR